MIATGQKVFCSYTLSDEDEKIVSRRMRTVGRAFEDEGIKSYCNLFDTNTYGVSCPKICLDIALEELRRCDMLFVVLTQKRSEGMLIEVGTAYAQKKPIILARHISTLGKTYLDRLANITMDWQTNEDLRRIIKSVIA